jgi:hypothetical protein
MERIFDDGRSTMAEALVPTRLGRRYTTLMTSMYDQCAHSPLYPSPMVTVPEHTPRTTPTISKAGPMSHKYAKRQQFLQMVKVDRPTPP